MSTKLPKTNLALIFKYGSEALGNRRKDLFLIAFVFILLPQMVSLFIWNQVSFDAVSSVGHFTGEHLIDQIEAFFSAISSKVLAWTVFSGGVGLIGVLALARTSVDYFESRPASVLDVSRRAMRILLTKGLGALALLMLVMPVIVALPLLRALSLSMLVMLPVTLVAGSKGGFRTTWDTIFLRYASLSQFGRWPVFINVLSVTGIFLTLFFTVSMGIESFAVLDTILEVPAGFLAGDVQVAGSSVNGGRLVSAITSIFWECLALAVLAPFTAATYHLSTVPEGHVDFKAKA